MKKAHTQCKCYQNSSYSFHSVLLDVQYGIMIDINNKDTISCLSASNWFGARYNVCTITLLYFWLSVCLHSHGLENCTNAFQNKFRHLFIGFIIYWTNRRSPIEVLIWNTRYEKFKCSITICYLIFVCYVSFVFAIFVYYYFLLGSQFTLYYIIVFMYK